MKRAIILSVLTVIFFTFLSSCSSQEIDVKSFKFAYLADTHISDVITNVEDLELSIDDINSLEDIDFVIFAGDITEFGSDEEILLAKEIIDRLKIPYYVVSGNHDSKWSESGCNTFLNVFGYEVFDFEFNGVRFLGTNSGPNMRMAPALVPRESMVWLDSVTNSVNKNTPVIFVNHYPLDNAMLNYKDVIEKLRRTNIQLSMCGHGHNNKSLDFDGIPGIMGRSNLRGGKVAAGYPGYNIVSIAGDSITFATRSNGVTQEPWHTMRMVKRVDNPNTIENYLPDSVAESMDIINRDSPVSVVWEFQDVSDIGSAPYYSNGVVFISNSAGYIKALDFKDGSVKWEFKTGGKIYSSPIVDVDEGVVIVGSTDNNIYGIDASNGQLRWKNSANKSVLGSAAIHNGLAFIGASDGTFRAIDVKTGETRWIYDQIKGFIEAKPWVDNQGVYIGDWANMVYAFDPVTGDLKWTWTNRRGRGLSAAAVWPVKANGKLFVVTPERRVHAIDASNGKELWSARGGREAIGLSEDLSAVYIKTMQDTVIAFDTRSYNRRDSSPIKIWESHAGYGYEIAPSPITSGYGMAFIPTDKGDIFSLDAQDGSFLWRYKMSIALINYVKPVGNNRLLVTSMDGKVSLLQL